MGSTLLVDGSAGNLFSEAQLEFPKLKSKPLLKRDEIVESATRASVLNYQNKMKLILNDVSFLPLKTLEHISKAAENEALNLFKELLKLRMEDYDLAVEKAKLFQAIQSAFLQFQTVNNEKKAQAEGIIEKDAENISRSSHNTESSLDLNYEAVKTHKLERFNGPLQKTSLALTTMDKQSVCQKFRWSMKIAGFPSRKEHAAVSVENVICSFGGINRGGHPTYSPDSLDVFVLNAKANGTKMKWKLLSTLAKNMFSLVIVSPNQRCGHSAVAYKEFVFVFGGEDSKTIEDLNSTHRLNTHTLKWDEVKLSGNVPCARYLHSAVAVQDKMFVFGGVLVTNDLFSLDLEMFYWSKVKTEGTPPSARSSHTATAFKGEFIFIFGGWDYEKVRYSDELFCFDVNSKEWTQPKTSGATPRGREGHSTFVHNGLIYIFGGSNFGSCFNDLFSFNPETCEWKEVTPIGHPPCPREKFGCVAVDSRVFIFGGFDSNNEKYLDDTFVLEME